MGRRTLGTSRGIAAATASISPEAAATLASTQEFSWKGFQKGINSSNAEQVQDHLTSAPVGAQVWVTRNRADSGNDALRATKQTDGSWKQTMLVVDWGDSHFQPQPDATSAKLAAHIVSSHKAGDIVQAKKPRKAK